MLSDVSDIQNEIIVRGSIQTTATSTSGITDTILNDWTREAHNFATSYKKFPFTEGRVSTTFAATEEWSFEGYKADSFRLVQVGGKRLQKLNFEDYQIFREEEPSADDRVYSDFGRLVFINPYADVSGTLTAYGQYQPLIDPTDKTATTIFSGYEDEGNEAIVEEMMSYLKERQQKSAEAKVHHDKALGILEGIWKRYQDEAFGYQTHPDRGGLFKRFDVLKGRATDELTKRDQF